MSPPRHVIELLGSTILVGPWLLDEIGALAAEYAPAHTVAIVSDENVAEVAGAQVVASLRHYAPNVRVILKAIPPGEQEKTRQRWEALTDWLLSERCGRDTTIVALGGGVVGDLAGFVAATFMRGVPVVQIPTSLLAMVDASVGGKVGVDTPHGKNLVGAFHQPALVVVDPTVLHTLPIEHLRAGFAELVKHGVICDAAYLERVAAIGEALLNAHREARWNDEGLSEAIATSIRIKASVVAEDERETGVRRILNFGHTVGHAIEQASAFSMLHGNAVAIGMVAEAKLAELAGVAPLGVHTALTRYLTRLGLPTRIPASIGPSAIVAAMQLDKKAKAGIVYFSLPARLGAIADPQRGSAVDPTLVTQALQSNSE